MVRKYPKSNVIKKKHFSQKEREEQIVKYAYLVKHIAGKMATRLPSSVLFDELVSAGCVGLIDAVDKFDPERDVNLKTYAAYRIKGSILDELRSMDWYSRSMRKKIRDIEKAVFTVESNKGGLADDNEIAEELGVELEKYHKTMAEIQATALLSLDEYLRDQENDSYTKKTFQNRIRSKDDPSENIAREELKKIVAKAIQNLSKKEQLVISLYYHDELTLKEVGKVLGLTESRICQIHTMALIKLKAKLKAYHEK